MTRRKALEQWETKIGNCEVTTQAVWPIATSLLEWEGLWTATAIHGPIGLKYHPVGKVTAIADCLEKEFTPSGPCDEIRERRWRPELKLCSKLQTSHSEKVKFCQFQTAMNTVQFNENCGFDCIQNECLRDLPRRRLVHITHSFYY